MKTLILLKGEEMPREYPGCRPIIYRTGNVHVRDQAEADVDVYPAQRIARVVFEP